MSTYHWLTTIKAWLFGQPRPASLQALQRGGGAGGGQAPQQLVLDPTTVQNGVRVTIPEGAVIKPQEQVWLQWASPESEGQFRTNEQIIPPLVPNTWDFKVPPQFIRWHIGKSLTVQYEVIERDTVTTHPSPALAVTVARVTGLPLIQSRQIISNRISLQNVANNNGKAEFTLPRWPLAATDQFVTVKVVGSGPGGEVTVVVADKLPVPDFAESMPVGHITLTDLRSFIVNQNLDIKVWVSFDQNAAPPQPFPTATPQLVA